jgi:hypothetical protein
MNRQLRAFLSIFTKKKIKYLGRAGMQFTDGDKQFYINTEIAFGKDFDLILYDRKPLLISNGGKAPIDPKESEEGFRKFEAELKRMGVRYMIASNDGLPEPELGL